MEIQQIQSKYTNDRIDYLYPSSKVECVNDDGDIRTEFVLNNMNDPNEYISTFIIPEGTKTIRFFPQNDSDGFITILGISVNGNDIDMPIPQRYWPKGISYFEVSTESIPDFNSEIKFKWSVISIEDFYK